MAVCGMNLKEIAQAAGVSQSTVTMVLHDRKGVGAATKERVSALLEANGYAIKRQIRGGRAQKSHFYQIQAPLADGGRQP